MERRFQYVSSNYCGSEVWLSVHAERFHPWSDDWQRRRSVDELSQVGTIFRCSTGTRPNVAYSRPACHNLSATDIIPTKEFHSGVGEKLIPDGRMGSRREAAMSSRLRRPASIADPRCAPLKESALLGSECLLTLSDGFHGQMISGVIFL